MVINDQVTQVISNYAQTWHKWFSMIERGASQLSHRMIELAGINGRQCILDIGTGIGEPALTAANYLNSQGSIVAVDLNADMIDIAKKRAAEKKINNIEFVQMTAENLSFESRSFDAVLSRWSLMFVTDIRAVFSAIYRILKPGRMLVAVVWHSPDQVPAIDLAKRIISQTLNLALSNYGAQSAFCLSDIESFKEQLKETGFSHIISESIPVQYEFASPQAYLENRTDFTGPLFNGLDNISGKDRQTAINAVYKALEPHQQPDGRIVISNMACCVVAKK